jgi:hypothetical protein
MDPEALAALMKQMAAAGNQDFSHRGEQDNDVFDLPSF